MRLPLRGWWLGALLVLCQLALGHDSRPLFVEVSEPGAGMLQLRWKTPSSLPRQLAPAVVPPEACERQGQVAESLSAEGVARRAIYRCRGDLSGQRLAIHYPDANPSLSTLIRYRGAKGQTHTAVLAPGETAWSLPDSERAGRVMGHYSLMGIEHIWLGVDHLLFLLCLLWIARTWRRVLLTVTGFTVAHSITLGLSALEVVELPIAPVEAVIALSILFLAREIALGRQDSLTWRYPVLVSSSFGLLHGFGFASVLAEVGLPQTEIPLALLFFNLGVEIGQVIFVLAVLALGWLAAQAAGVARARGWPFDTARVGALAVYGVGVLAAFWFVERLQGFA